MSKKLLAWDTEFKEWIPPHHVYINGNGLIHADTGKEWVEVGDQEQIELLFETGLKDSKDNLLYNLDIYIHNDKKFIIIDTVNMGI